MDFSHLERPDVSLRRRKNFKILVGAPQNQIKKYIQDTYLERITNFTWPNYDICLVDNSPTFLNKKELNAKGIFALHVEPKGRPNQAYMAESLEMLRKRTLDKDYDFLFINETDIIAPHNIIERLLVHQKPVVSASYFIGEGSARHLMIQENEPYVGGIGNIANINRGKDILFATGQLKKVYACGIGCILIHRDILQKIKFRWEPGANVHPDSFFAADLFMQQIPQYLDTSILCEHYNQNWNTVTDYRMK